MSANHYIVQEQSKPKEVGQALIEGRHDRDGGGEHTVAHNLRVEGEGNVDAWICSEVPSGPSDKVSIALLKRWKQNGTEWERGEVGWDEHVVAHSLRVLRSTCGILTTLTLPAVLLVRAQRPRK